MPWAKIDDALPGHRKVDALLEAQEDRGLAALGLWTLMLAHSAQQLTDGKIGARVIRRLAPDNGDELVARLVDVGLVDVDGSGWCIHDYLDFNPSREKVLADRAASAKRQAEARARRDALRESQRDETGDEPRDTGGDNPPNVPRESHGPDPTRPIEKKNPSDSVAANGDGDAISEVWAAYDETRRLVLGDRSAAKLTPARRQLITRRLRDWPRQDLIDAVRGWQHSPHNRGENDREQPYCDLELLLRDAAHIERFRDLQRHGRIRTKRTLNGVVKHRGCANCENGFIVDENTRSAIPCPDCAAGSAREEAAA